MEEEKEHNGMKIKDKENVSHENDDEWDVGCGVRGQTFKFKVKKVN